MRTLRPIVLAALAAAACGATAATPDAALVPDAGDRRADAATPDAAAPDAPPGDAPLECDAGTVASRIQITFDATNAEWVKGLTWVDSQSVTTANLATWSGAASCSGANEQFGQLYGAPEGNPPYLVGGNTLATLHRCGADATIVSAPATCDTRPVPQTPVTTTYHFYDGAKASQVRIARTIGFDATTPVYSGIGVRPYVPRPPVATLPTVIYPNAAGTATTSTATCGGDCFIEVGAKWSGRWFADVGASGLAIIVLRDPAMTSPVDLTVNNDTGSGSNLSSFVLLQPTGGWKAPVTEIEYLCFADLPSWPQAERDAAVLPAWCGP